MKFNINKAAFVTISCFLTANDTYYAKATTIRSWYHGIEDEDVALVTAMSKAKEAAIVSATSKIETFPTSLKSRTLQFSDDTVENQCLTDTNDLVESLPELAEAKAAFESAFKDAIVGSDKSTFDGLDILTMDVPYEEKIVYEQACTDAGLNAADIDDLFMSCTRSGVNYYSELKNYADCTAPTEECDSVDMNQLTVDTFFNYDPTFYDDGMECTLKSKGSGGVISASNAVAAAATMFAVATILMVW